MKICCEEKSLIGNDEFISQNPTTHLLLSKSTDLSWRVCWFVSEKVLTHIRVVVDEDDFVNERGRGSVEDAVHRSQQHRPRLVVEADHHAGVRQLRHRPVLQILTAATSTRWLERKSREGDGNLTFSSNHYTNSGLMAWRACCLGRNGAGRWGIPQWPQWRRQWCYKCRDTNFQWVKRWKQDTKPHLDCSFNLLSKVKTPKPTVDVGGRWPMLVNINFTSERFALQINSVLTLMHLEGQHVFMQSCSFGKAECNISCVFVVKHLAWVEIVRMSFLCSQWTHTRDSEFIRFETLLCEEDFFLSPLFVPYDVHGCARRTSKI